MKDLSERVVFVTGASRGIGKAVAQRCAAAGATVVACARDDHAQPVVDEIAASGGTAIAQSLEVTDAVSVTEAVRAIVDAERLRRERQPYLLGFVRHLVERPN